MMWFLCFPLEPPPLLRFWVFCFLFSFFVVDIIIVHVFWFVKWFFEIKLSFSNLFFFLLNCVNIFEILIVRFWGKRWKTLLRIRGGQLRVSEPAVPLALPLLGPLLNIGGVRLTGTAFHKCNYSESKSFSVEVWVLLTWERIFLDGKRDWCWSQDNLAECERQEWIAVTFCGSEDRFIEKQLYCIQNFLPYGLSFCMQYSCWFDLISQSDVMYVFCFFTL